jgi:hypothetical protein
MKRAKHRAWRIDALDPRGGLAFASYRSADLLTDDQSSADGPGVFIEAPDFRVENISSRAIGLAAGERSFQIGLFLRDSEVAFETLADLVEFVRRCYLRGAGGGGADGNSLPFTPGEGPPPDIPPLDQIYYENLEGAEYFRKDVETFSILTQKLSCEAGRSIETQSSPWNVKAEDAVIRAGDMARGAVVSLVRGASVIILEMLRRYPLSGSERELIRWYIDAESLGCALRRLNVFWHIHKSPYAKVLIAAIQTIQGKIRGHLHRLPIHPDSPPEFVILDSLFRWPVGVRPIDPVDDLARWPIPAEVNLHIESGLATGSVLELISSIQSSPIVIETSARMNATLVFDIALLGATHITWESQQYPGVGNLTQLSPQRGSSSSSPIDLAELRITCSAENACAWIVDQMPRLIFPEALEKIILQTAVKSYAD